MNIASLLFIEISHFNSLFYCAKKRLFYIPKEKCQE